MAAWLRRRLTYANVMATIAAFLALGGGTTAVALQGRNTVDSGDIINRQVKTADIENGGVRSADVRDDSLTGGGLDGADINEATLGQVPNADTLDGRSASSFITNSTYLVGPGQERAGSTLGDGSKVLSQSCLAGDRLLSGGPASVNVNSDVLDSFASDVNTWQARINDSAVPGGDSFTVVALCAPQ